MPGQYWAAGLPPFHVADAAAVTASGSLTELSPVPQIIVPAPFLQEFGGKRFLLEAGGVYTTTGTQGTVTFTLAMGAPGAIGSMTAIAASSAITWVASQTNRFWRLEGLMQIRTTGSSGTCVAILEIANVSSGGTDLAGTTAGGTAAVDTTSVKAIALGATLSVVSQSITCRYFNVASVN